MKNPLDYISDLWERVWFREEVLLDRPELAILVFIQRFTGAKIVSVVTARDFAQASMVQYRAFEVDDVKPEGWAHLLRILDNDPSIGELVVWLWHQGVSQPVEIWTAEK